jgi:hypothetical protein
MKCGKKLTIGQFIGQSRGQEFRRITLRSKCTLKREEVLTFLLYGQNREEKGQHPSLGMASGFCWDCSQSIFEVGCL